MYLVHIHLVQYIAQYYVFSTYTFSTIHFSPSEKARGFTLGLGSVLIWTLISHHPPAGLLHSLCNICPVSWTCQVLFCRRDFHRPSFFWNAPSASTHVTDSSSLLQVFAQVKPGNFIHNFNHPHCSTTKIPLSCSLFSHRLFTFNIICGLIVFLFIVSLPCQEVSLISLEFFHLFTKFSQGLRTFPSIHYVLRKYFSYECLKEAVGGGI